jgi:xanthine dehydrogenase molybdenum-binding subunit
MYGLTAEEPYEPWKWPVPANAKYIGKTGVRRLDGWVKASGKATYARDISRPGMLYAKNYLSPYPHAKIKSMDTSKAEALPGVRAVFRYDDPSIQWPYHGSGSPSYIARFGPTTLCQGPEARWYPEPVAAIVVADSELLCDEGLRLIEIDWDVLPFVIFPEDWAKSLEPGASLTFPELNPENNMSREIIDQYGDIEKGLSEAPNLLDVELNVEEDVWAGVEGSCAVAEMIGDDCVELWHHVAGAIPSPIAPWLKLNKMILHTPYGGGTFGSQGCSYMFAEGTSTMLTKLTGKPIKYLWDGSHFNGSGEHLGTYKMTIGYKDDGTVTAVKYHTILSGDYADQMNKIHKGSKIENLYIKMQYPYQNRGTQVCYKHGDNACTMHNEVFAQVASALNMDPTEVALINDGCAGISMADMAAIKAEQGFDPSRDSLKECLEIGKKAIDWDNKWHAPGTKILPNGNYHGIGFQWMIAWESGYLHRGGVGLRINTDGTVSLLAGSADTGPNRETTYAEVVADELGVKFESVYFRTIDKEVGFWLAMPGGSSGLIGNLQSLVRAAKKAKQLVLEYAAKERPGAFGGPPQPALFPGKTPEELDTKDGDIFEKANPDNKIPIATLAGTFSTQLFAWDYAPSVTANKYVMVRQCWFMEVEVDPDTGKCDVKKVVSVYDGGKVISPEGFEDQQYGGTYMGVGRSNTEQVIWDPIEGVKLNDNLIGYDIALMNDITEGVDCYAVETGLSYGPYGTCGCSEAPAANVSGLTRYAVHNAIGKWVDLKTTPDKILKALGKA